MQEVLKVVVLVKKRCVTERPAIQNREMAARRLKWTVVTRKSLEIALVKNANRLDRHEFHGAFVNQEYTTHHGCKGVNLYL